MTPIDRYTLESHAGPYESWPATSALLIDGQATQTRVSGFVIEAQYACRYGTLLITSYDCPFEESNTFTLLDAANIVIAKTELVIPYSAFLLHKHWPIDAYTIGLHYYQGIFHTLHVQERGMFTSKPKLKLRTKLAWKSDERMAQSYARMAATLAEIERSRSTK